MRQPISASNVVTAEELGRRCEWVAKRNLETLVDNRELPLDYYFGKGPGDLLYRLRLEMLGPFLNSGVHKSILFAILRRLLEKARYDCAIFASDTWGFQGNEKYRVLSEEQQRALTDRGFEKLVSLGYGRVCEALNITGQTPELAHQVVIRYQRDALTGQIIRTEPIESNPIHMAGGRAKMWGAWNEPGMPEAYELAGQLIHEFYERGLDLENSTTLVNIACEDPEEYHGQKEHS